MLRWLRKSLVDVAVVTPGLATQIEATSRGQHDPQAVPGIGHYLATVASVATASGQEQAAANDTYQSVCLVARDSRLKTLQDVRQAAAGGHVEFLFVHPLSVSGWIAPAFALRQLGITPTREQIRFTYSHSDSLREVASASPKERVAFVQEGTEQKVPELAGAVRALPIPQLDALKIPQNIVVARVGFLQANLIQKLLIDYRDPAGRQCFRRSENWEEQYREVREWSKTIPVPTLISDGDERQSLSLAEMGQLLVHHARSQPTPPRLAVVLSGGGAKCSYQVGVIAALEERLARLRQQNPDARGLNIALVVGTSGGAINAVPVALGVQQTEAGREAFTAIWTELDQREIVRPSAAVRWNMGLWFAFFVATLVLGIMARWVPQPERQVWISGGFFTLAGATLLLLRLVPWSPWHWLGTNHIAHHIWLWLGFGISGAGWSLFWVGLLVMAWQAVLVRRGRSLQMLRRDIVRALFVGLLGLPLIQVVTILWREQTLSGGEGMEQSLADKLPRLIDQHLAAHQLPPLTPDPQATATERLRTVSREVLVRRLLTWDLVITGSCLEQSGSHLPADLYFHVASGSHPQPPAFGGRGIALADHPLLLLDVVLGSGSIYPVFPPRTLPDFPQAGQQIALVDGGFAHNSPIEAAVLWGATHIVLVEASPAERTKRHHFLQNVAASFDHLYAQSQLLDAHSRGRVMIFSLAPTPPHLCVLDFAGNLVAESIARGYRDATTPEASGLHRFTKEPGEPMFLEAR